MSDFANPSTPWPSTGMLTLVLAESPNPFLRTTAPQLLIDSTPHLCHWGYNQIPLAPGPQGPQPVGLVTGQVGAGDRLTRGCKASWDSAAGR